MDTTIDSEEVECASTASPGPVSVEVPTFDPSSIQVFFHDPTGAVVAMRTGSSTSATLPPCSSVTVVEQPAGEQVSGFTMITGVQPGETIYLGRVGSGPTIDLDEWTVRVEFPPTGRPIEFHGGYDPRCVFTSATSPAIGHLVEECFRSGTKTFDLLAIDRVNGAPVAFATASIQTPTAPTTEPPGATIPGWRTDFAPTVMNVASVPSDFTTVVGLVPIDDGRPMSTLLSSTATPATIQFPPFGDRAYRLTQLYASPDPSTESLIAEDVVTQPLADSTLDVAAEIPFRITSLTVTNGPRPVVSWETAGATTTVDLAAFCIDRDVSPYKMCAYVDPSRRSMRFPDLPASVLSPAPMRRVLLRLEDNAATNGYGEAHLEPLRGDGRTGIRYPNVLRNRRAFRNVELE